MDGISSSISTECDKINCMSSSMKSGCDDDRWTASADQNRQCVVDFFFRTDWAIVKNLNRPLFAVVTSFVHAGPRMMRVYKYCMSLVNIFVSLS